MRPRLPPPLTKFCLVVLFSTGVTIGLNQLAGFSTASSGKVLSQTSEYLPETINLLTTSRFTYKTSQEVETLPFRKTIVKDANLEWGAEELRQEGENGQLIRTIQIIFYNQEEIGRELVKTERREPKDEITAQGTKMVIRETETPDGKIRYQGKFSVWATSYDGHCPGCRGLTYSGTPVRHGTIAVDPELIPLGSNLYVPGYGFGRAEDIGGAIKGKRLDLGFENLAQGSWSARWVDVYVLD